ncbi:condensation domain-containing protein [Rhodoferax sp.]|uniref:phthiocerol/phthiodiolone dimycocerosyl transferase family protein n=1 Tax=Rhodoferax sp. TaxID=50421 RepID=UPI0025F934F4|nr:condensation domain-containing protein [Rhodoferax sp.]
MSQTLPAVPIIRPLDPGEAFFYMSDLVSCMNFVVFAERRGQLEHGRIRSALDLLQQENLLLQASIHWTQENGLCFAHAPGRPVELRCQSVTHEAWQRTIEQQLSEPFDAATEPLMRCLYLEMPSPARSVLALCFHHAIADGRSGTALLRRLLSVMAARHEPPLRTGPSALPAMAKVHPARYRWSEQADTARALKATLVADYRRHGPLPAIPWLASEAAERTPRFIRLSLPAEATRHLLAAARARGTTVHGALCAAQLLAQSRLQPGLQATSFFLSCPVDMRVHLEPVQPESPTGLFVSLISATFSVSADTDFWQLARDIITQTRLQIARGEGHLLFNLFGLDGSPVLPEQLASFKKRTLGSLPNTMVSNVGAIATVTEDPAVDAISFALCPMPYQTLFTAASSYHDQLILNVGFDAARLTESNARILAQHMLHILSTEASTTSVPATCRSH